MQNSMLNTADILINRHPVINRLCIKHTAIVICAAVSFKIPGGFNKRIHCIGFSSCVRAAAFWTPGSCEIIETCKRRLSPGQKIGVFG